MFLKTVVKCVLLFGSFVLVSSIELKSEDDSFKNWRNMDNSLIGVNVSSSSSKGNVLSRKRRFLYPAVTPWFFDIRDIVITKLLKIIHSTKTGMHI
jgi:hypothetical protein